MSLKFRLNLIINCLLLLILLAGGLLTVNTARQNARAEIASAEKMVLYLFDTVSISTGQQLGSGGESIYRLQKLSHLRHLKIELRDTSGRMIDSNSANQPQKFQSEAPEWFENLLNNITPRWVPTVRKLETQGQVIGELVITPDPTYEYAEIWKQVSDLITLSVLFLVTVNLMVSWAVGQALKPTEKILIALNELERGNLSARLPVFDLPELSRIGQKFNLMVETLESTVLRNHKLSQQLITLQEEERKSLARDLHDEFGQCLTAINTDATVLLNLAERKYPEIRESAAAISELSRHLMELVSGLLQRLRPGILDELGLVAAVQDLVDTWCSRNIQVPCSLAMEDVLTPLNESIEITAYRLVQECLTNISRHAAASTVEIRLAMEARGIQNGLAIQVRDNGRGFEAEQTDGLGLPGMRERVEGLGGQFELRTGHGQGTEVLAWIPVKGDS